MLAQNSSKIADKFNDNKFLVHIIMKATKHGLIILIERKQPTNELLISTCYCWYLLAPRLERVLSMQYYSVFWLLL
jgi:hypothetical protein